MTKNEKSTEDHDQKMRNIAEERQARSHKPLTSEQSMEELIYELEVHQIELEMQAEELRIANDAIQESRNKYLDLYQFAPVGYITLTNNAQITEVNLTLTKMLGINRSRLINKPFRRFIIDPDLKDWDCFLMKTVSGDEDQVCSIRLKKFDGEDLHVQLKATKMNDESKNFSNLRISITDITEIKRYESALQLSNDKLHLLSSITRHDILNQVMILQGYLQLATEEADPEKRNCYLDHIEMAGLSIQKFVEFTSFYERVGLDKPLWQKISTLVPSISVNSIKIDNRLGDLSVFADPMIKKVLFNLTQNSIMHGKKVTQIKTHYEISGSDCIIFWQDDGIGIVPEDKLSIFRKGIGVNTRMGLFLSQQILTITGISIKETGVYGGGASFEIRIPEGKWRLEPV